MGFQTEALVKKYGSWVRVQVAFYDFLFEKASGMCASCFTGTAIDNVAAHQWADGCRFYELTIKKLEEIFATPDEAWQSFLEGE